MSYFHLGREVDDSLESRIQSFMLNARNRPGRDDEPNGNMAEADGDITLYWTGMNDGQAK